MDPLIAALLFLSNIVDDALAVLFVRRTAAGKAVQSMLISGLLTILIAFSVTQYVENKIYLVPVVVGSMIGSFVTIHLDRANRRRKNRRKAKDPTKGPEWRGV